MVVVGGTGGWLLTLQQEVLCGLEEGREVGNVPAQLAVDLIEGGKSAGDGRYRPVSLVLAQAVDLRTASQHAGRYRPVRLVVLASGRIGTGIRYQYLVLLLIQ